MDFNIPIEQRDPRSVNPFRGDVLRFRLLPSFDTYLSLSGKKKGSITSTMTTTTTRETNCINYNRIGSWVDTERDYIEAVLSNSRRVFKDFDITHMMIPLNLFPEV